MEPYSISKQERLKRILSRNILKIPAFSILTIILTLLSLLGLTLSQEFGDVFVILFIFPFTILTGLQLHVLIRIVYHLQRIVRFIYQKVVPPYTVVYFDYGTHQRLESQHQIVRWRTVQGLAIHLILLLLGLAATIYIDSEEPKIVQEFVNSWVHDAIISVLAVLLAAPYALIRTSPIGIPTGEGIDILSIFIISYTVIGIFPSGNLMKEVELRLGYELGDRDQLTNMSERIRLLFWWLLSTISTSLMLGAALIVLTD